MRTMPGLLITMGIAAGMSASGASGDRPAELPQGRAGIAARYPGDKGIESDPKVVFVERFDQDSIDALAKRYDNVKRKDIMTFSNDALPGSADGQCLLITHTGGDGTGAHLYNRIRNRQGGWGYDRLFARFYVRFDKDCHAIHHFGTNISGRRDPKPWPIGQAGLRPKGDERFSVSFEPHGKGWTWDYYAYWMEMGGSPPAGKTWGNSFIRDPALKVDRDRWICIELMVTMNDLGESNGEVACWIDGKRVSHLGQGFPNGKWTYDKFTPGEGGGCIRWDDKQGGPARYQVPEGGAPFAGFRWRTVKELNVNIVKVSLYITTAPKGHVSKVRYDNVVVAEEYIGPVASIPPSGGN
ncbi:MAG: hypothetical protein JXR37_26565 [Kiritimatiellae bacterium]|nr:hypothetical protein [Kiritimatiellia bacterium]